MADKNIATETLSGFSLWLCLIATVIYFVVKYYVIDKKSDPSTNSNFSYGIAIVIYLLVCISFQMIECTTRFSKICPGNDGSNFLLAFTYCIIPWIFIFLPTYILLYAFPYMVRPFSDTIGYIGISFSTNSALEEYKDDLKNYSYNNYHLFIDKVKDEVKPQIINKLRIKDSIGNACWYVLIIILISAIIENKMSLEGCTKTYEQLEKDFQETIDKNNDISNNQFNL